MREYEGAFFSFYFFISAALFPLKSGSPAAVIVIVRRCKHRLRTPFFDARIRHPLDGASVGGGGGAATSRRLALIRRGFREDPTRFATCATLRIMDDCSAPDGSEATSSGLPLSERSEQLTSMMGNALTQRVRQRDRCVVR